MKTNASWLEFEQSTAKLSGIPENDDVGEFWVNISVNDTEYIDFSNFTLQVLNVNDPPRIVTKDNTTAFEDEFYEMMYMAKDIDNTQNELFWDINTNAKWLDYDIQSAIINGTPTNDDIGEYWVNISVSDNEFIDFTNFTLTVINTNDPPIITTKDKTNATVGELYSINYEAMDIDPPPITLTWSLKTNTSDWLTIDIYNGWLNGVPSINDVGTFWVNISVTDGNGGGDFHNFTLKILKTPFQRNHPPKLYGASMTPLAGDTKTEFTFSVHYYDEDGDAPVFIEMVIDGDDHELKLKPGENPSNGTYEYKITLSEGSHNYYFIAFDGLETVKTGNFTTSDIKSVKDISQERASWFWLIWIIIIMVVIISILVFILFKKRKAPEMPTVKAELLQVPSKPLVLPTATPSVKEPGPLPASPAPPVVSDQLPAPIKAPAPVETQYQLPKATLSKVQRLELLDERFLRGEVDLETYKELKTKIEGQGDGDITRDESEEEASISEQQQPEVVKGPTVEDTSQTETSEQVVVDEPPQEIPIKPEITEPQPTTKTQQPEELSTEKETEEKNNDKKI
jgi:hypothetical protein